MAGNPVENKAEAPKAADVLAAAAGVPTPAQAKGVWALVRRYRKFALLLGGFGIVGVAGGYGYKYFTATPPKANAQAETPAAAGKPEEPKPADEHPVVNPPTLPVKSDTPAVPEINLPDIRMPNVKAPAVKPPDKADTDPPPIVPPAPAEKPKKSVADDLPDIAPPPIADIKVADTDPKKPADEVKAPTGPAIPTITLPNDKKKPADAADPFKATDKVPTDTKLGPAPLPADVTDKKKPDAPVIRVQGTDPKVEVPAPTPEKKGDVPTIKVPNIDINPPPPPGGKTDDAPVVPPPGKTDDVPTVKVPGPKPDVPPVVVGPVQDKAPEVPPLPGVDPPVKPPVADPPTIPPIDIKAGPVPAGPVKKDSYDELWHDDHGEPYAAISREYYHDPKYAAALEAYNKHRRDKIIRVPPPWVLEEKFPDLVGKERAPAEAKPKDGGGLKFEPVSPLPGSGRPAPASTASRPTDEYRVTAEAGETIREAARKALGDAGAWKKLYELNPNIDPTLPLPAGTILRLK